MFEMPFQILPMVTSIPLLSSIIHSVGYASFKFKLYVPRISLCYIVYCSIVIAYCVDSMSILLSLLIPFGTQGPSHALFLEQDEPGAVFWNYHGCGSKVNAQEHGLSLVPSILKAAHFFIHVPKMPKTTEKKPRRFFSPKWVI